MRCNLLAFAVHLTDVAPGDGGFCIIRGSHKSNFKCPPSIRCATACGGVGVWGCRGANVRVWGAGCKVRGAGCRVQGSGCGAQGSGCRVQSAGCRVQGAGRRVQGAGCRVQGPGYEV
jgi:hypothetical protein